ncbi:MAG: permease, partial [Deltaproteobacteria bacterium]
ILAAFAVAAFIIAYYQGEGRLTEGLKRAMDLTIMVIPLIFFALLLAGLIQVIIPKQFVADWLGDQSGFKGIMMGTLMGALTPGGPSVTLPLAAGFLGAGAGIGSRVQGGQAGFLPLIPDIAVMGDWIKNMKRQPLRGGARVTEIKISAI